MHRIVSRHEGLGIQTHQSAQGEPAPQIIDHRQENQQNKKKQQTYEIIKKQRDDLLVSELKYSKRIKELEKENEDLLKLYEPTYKENEQLKSQIQYGPESQNIKKLRQEKKKLFSELEIVKEENIELQDRVKDLEKMFLSEKEYYLEKKWREAIEKGRKRREERDTLISTQGPFPTSRKPKKRDLKSISDDEFEKQDAHDLHIDTLEKETQILLNKIRRIKQNKESIDYAYFIGKGAVTRNSSVAKAINEKLDKDLEQFENRLENLRRRTKQLKNNSSEELEMPEKKLKIKQFGTKYFRTRHTQTDHGEEQSDLALKTENASVEQSKSKPMKKTILRRGSKKGALMIKSKTPDVDVVLESRSESVANRDTQNTEIHTPSNISRSPNERENDDSPIAEHWRHLAIKLNEAEKYGGKTPYRDKIKGRASVQSSGSRRHESLSYVPERKTSTRPNSEEIVTLSAKSQRNESVVSKSTSTEISTRSTKHVESQSETDELQREHDIEDMTDTEKEMEKGKRIKITQRKTTNLGEEIRFIPREQSLQTVKYDQMGRYANGFEPISRKKKTDNKVNNAYQMKDERKSLHSNGNTTVENNEGKRGRELPKDAKFQQRVYSGETTKQNTLQVQSGLRNGRITDTRLKSPADAHQRIARNASLNVNRNAALRRTSPSQDYKMVSRNYSAYDEVLADVKKQYNDHARRQMANSIIQFKTKDNNESDTTRLTGNINDEHPFTYHIDLKSDNRSIFEREQKGMTDRNRKSQEYVYNLDLL